jgi:BMFP domain-containing protein YqiC
MADPRTTRVYNRGERSFTHGKHVLAPRSFLEVSEEVAELWFRLFENDVIEASVAQREVGGAQAELAKANEKLAALEAELAALKAKGGKGKKSEDDGV